VINNIAEGFERGTRADFARFLDIAKGSCGEVRSMTYIAEDLGYMNASQASDIR
jgi:four helix bundle protein